MGGGYRAGSSCVRVEGKISPSYIVFVKYASVALEMFQRKMKELGPRTTQ